LLTRSGGTSLLFPLFSSLSSLSPLLVYNPQPSSPWFTTSFPHRVYDQWLRPAKREVSRVARQPGRCSKK